MSGMRTNRADPVIGEDLLVRMGETRFSQSEKPKEE
jgi:hypothetical protein